MGLKRVLGHNFGGKGALWGTILMVKRVLGHNFGVRGLCGAQFWWYKGPWGTIVGLKRVLGHNFGGKGALWGTILMVKRVLGHNFGANKGLGLFFMKAPMLQHGEVCACAVDPPPPM